MEAQVKAISNLKIDKLTVWDSGKGSDGKSQHRGFPLRPSRRRNNGTREKEDPPISEKNPNETGFARRIGSAVGIRVLTRDLVAWLETLQKPRKDRHTAAAAIHHEPNTLLTK